MVANVKRRLFPQIVSSLIAYKTRKSRYQSPRTLCLVAIRQMPCRLAAAYNSSVCSHKTAEHTRRVTEKTSLSEEVDPKRSA
jgi:hypothetical protein